MKKSQLSQLIRETVAEVFNELQEDISLSAGSAQETNESTPPNFPSALKKKLISKYGETPKAYATMWTLHKKMEEGDNRVCEMWMAWEGKKVNEEDEDGASAPSPAPEGGEEVDQDAEHDETDMGNPEEKKEVDLANQIKKLADELLAMHGATQEEPEGEEVGGEEGGEDEIEVDDEEEKEPVAEVKKAKRTKKTSKKKSK